MTFNNLQKNLIIFFSVVLSILIISIFWEKITIPLNNNLEVKGSLSIKGYNPNNDTLRYILFIFLPLSVYLFLNFVLKRKVLNFYNLFFEKEKKITNNQPILLFLAFIFIALIFLEFLSLELTNYRLDLLHDGVFLTPAQNYLSYKSFWTSSYMVHGGSDIFYPLLTWKFFETLSIGSTRSFIFILIFLIKIFSVLLSYQFTKILNLTKETKILFFAIFTTILISLSYYEAPLNYSYFSYRDLFLILFLIFFIELFIHAKPSSIYPVSISLIATISILLHHDIGFYLNLLLIIYCFYLFFVKKYKEILLIIFSTLFFWFFAVYLFGFDELKAFFENIKTIVLSMDLMHGLKYPVPFFSIGENPHGARATRGLIMQLTSGLFVLNYIFSEKNNITSSKRILFIFLFFLSFIMYKNALGRSDSYHIRISCDLPILINSFFILNYLLSFVEKKLVNTRYLSNKVFFSLSILFICIFNIYNLNDYKINNITNFKKNVQSYVNLPDEKFIDNKLKKFINYYGDISQKDKCIQIFTYDSALPYLLKKPSCTKYYETMLASPVNKQIDYVNDLKQSKPKYILYKSLNSNFGIVSKLEPPELYERLSLVNNYILSSYRKYVEFEGYTIFELK